MQLNQRATRLATRMRSRAGELRLEPHTIGGARVLDLGVRAPGGIGAGVAMAEVCLAGFGEVSIAGGPAHVFDGPWVWVRTDHPVAACLASQYAGWEVQEGDYFAMGSGPMRAAYGREELFDAIGLRESAERAVGVLEADALPTPAVCEMIAAKCSVKPEALTLLAAPTTSLAGTVQIAARSVETALHKLHEIGFDVSRIESACGAAPLPPPAADAVAAIGRTNDAILYGGHATLFVRGDDDSLREVGARVPSSSSPDHGRPFAEVFAGYDHDFYKVDKLLFSPAMVTLANLDTGRVHRFGAYAPRVIARSFGLDAD
ncbi:Methenyltetrahydromethanopterin cyclohydrolase [Pirellulimonas nuda]|uniref:Methenyltetrahydromethanopterin cyclohydrolase n=1 Tax=Pirellulimonas nuda TaxID=2528009 RepID=A0A518DGL3_9BACT|nr:methenyltetrahydromethanopterin cyclohydrolase [Pirellulimonas nuda]QDU90609.1 Methenyltetrahydromethanopterin cyclohydrolase [Pirellulimonas nuda]